MGLKKFVKKVGKSIEQSTKAVAALPKGIIKQPDRLLTGSFDPISTGLWNKILGRNYDPLVNQVGGPTKKTLNDVGANRLARGAFKGADILATTLGTAGAANGVGNAFGSVGAGAGGAGGAGGLETFPVGAGGTDVAAGGLAGGSSASGLSNILGNYGQYLGPLISGVGQVVGANAAVRGADRGIDEIRRQFDINRSDNQPWMDTGINALGGLNRLAAGDYSAFMNSPDYLYSRDQYLKGVENSAAARGGLYSGQNLKALGETASGLASQNLGNYRNQLLSMAGLGQTATNTNIQAGSNAASNIAGLQTNIGDVRGSGIAGLGNELGNAFDTYYGRRYGRKINPYSTYGGV